MNYSQNCIPLALGTAQLGMNYGIANKTGKPTQERAFEVVKTALDSGICFFDTAQAYGNAEEVLGRCLKALKSIHSNTHPAVITKLDPNMGPWKIDSVLRKVDESLEKLGLEEIWGLMMHRESQMTQNRKVQNECVLRLKDEKKIKYFGVSVYSPDKAITALNLDEIDMIQVPFNIFNQKAYDEGVFQLARKRRKLIFVRSVYLQGLLSMDQNQVPDELTFLREPLRRYIHYSRELGIIPKLMALGFVLQKAPDAMIVIGAETPDQVKENVVLYEKSKNLSLPDLKCLSINDQKIINPSKWRQ